MDMTGKQTSSPKRSRSYAAKLLRYIGAWGLAPSVKSLLMIVGISALVVWVGAGCKSLPGKLEIDTPFIDVEYDGSVG